MMDYVKGSCPNCSNPIETIVGRKGYIMSPIICKECYALLKIQNILGEWVLEVEGIVEVHKIPRVP
jgi:hypothetical protein